MMPTRRRALRSLGAGALAAGLSASPLRTLAQAPAKRELNIGAYAYVLDIEIPAASAMFEGIAAMPAYAQPRISKFETPQTITSTLLSGSIDLAEDGPESVIAAHERGSDLKIFGYFYRTADLVFVANSDRISTLKDFEKPDNAIAVSEKTDSSWVMFLGPLLKNGIDPSKVNVVEVGGSSSRMRALLSGRAQAVAMHADQAADVMRQGPYKIIFEPSSFYKIFPTEVWAASGAWLKKPENARAAIDVIKATTIAFRRANRDFPWYLQMYHKYATIPSAKDMTAERLQPIWRHLSTELNAWPDTGVLTPEEFAPLMPIYKAAGVFSSAMKASDVVDVSYATQAMKELGRQGMS